MTLIVNNHFIVGRIRFNNPKFIFLISLKVSVLLKCDSDLDGGSEHGRHGNCDCHCLVVEGCVVKHFKRDKE